MCRFFSGLLAQKLRLPSSLRECSNGYALSTLGGFSEIRDKPSSSIFTPWEANTAPRAVGFTVATPVGLSETHKKDVDALPGDMAGHWAMCLVFHLTPKSSHRGSAASHPLLDVNNMCKKFGDSALMQEKDIWVSGPIVDMKTYRKPSETGLSGVHVSFLCELAPEEMLDMGIPVETSSLAQTGKSEAMAPKFTHQYGR